MSTEKFEYDYSAPNEKQRTEIEIIRNKYMPKTTENSDFKTLKTLDNKVHKIPFILSLSLGIVALLIFGVGLCCILEWQNLWLGVAVSIIGIAAMIAVYPLHKWIVSRQKNKYANRIIDLSNQLLNE